MPKERPCFRNGSEASLGFLLVLHEIVHDGEVLVGQSLGHQGAVDLMRESSQRDRRVGGGGHGGSDSQILGDESGGETSGVTLASRGIGEHSGHGVVDLGGPAAAGGGVDDVAEYLGVQAESVGGKT